MKSISDKKIVHPDMNFKDVHVLKCARLLCQNAIKKKKKALKEKMEKKHALSRVALHHS